MNKKIVLFLLLTPLIVSCSNGAGGSKGSPVYTVTFLNDSGTSIGYAYVIEGKKAIFKDNDASSPYDFLPTLKKRDDGINASHYVFDGWEGEYEESYGETNRVIDPSSIKHDCTLKAKFVRKSYGFKVSFRSEMKTLYGVSLLDNALSYGNGVSFDKYYEPSMNTLSLDYPFKENPKMDPSHLFYYEEARFKGWNALAGDAKKGTAFSFNEEKKWQLSIDVASWDHNEAPALEASAKEGVLLLNTTYNEKGQPDYPAYFSNGESWVSLGLLSRTPTLTFDASFSTSRRSFEVYEYASKEDALMKKSGKLLGTLLYGTRLEIDVTSPKNVLRYGKDEDNDGIFDETPATQNLSYTSPLQEWSGFCYGFSNFEGQIPLAVENDRYPLDFAHITCNTALYPLQSLEEK